MVSCYENVLKIDGHNQQPSLVVMVGGSSILIQLATNNFSLSYNDGKAMNVLSRPLDFTQSRELGKILIKEAYLAEKVWANVIAQGNDWEVSTKPKEISKTCPCCDGTGVIDK